VLPLALMLASACGTLTRPHTRTTVPSTNFNAQGAWLGEPSSPPATRDCGYLTHALFIVADVRIRDLTCAQAASVVDTYLGQHLHAPPTWSTRFRGPQKGAPRSLAMIKGSFELQSMHGPGLILGILIRGAQPGSLSGEIHFGCHNQSSICPS